MNHDSRLHRMILALVSVAALASPMQAAATVVEVQTVLGNFRINLFDQNTPVTVANYLNYVNNGDYTNSIFHRSVPGFVIQGGGFVYNGAIPIDNVMTNAAIANEPRLSNVRGTVAMAKLAGNPNSATSQWFVNLANNSASLDGDNGGFTVFGIVMDNGMDVVDAIAALLRFNFSSPLNELPLQNYTATDFNNGTDPTDNNFIIVNAVVVVDSNTDTGASLLPPANTTVNPVVTPTPTLSGGGGGSVSLFVLFTLLGVVCRRRFS